MAGLANFTHEHYGHEFCVLDPITVNLVAHTDKFVSKYQRDWNNQIKQIDRSILPLSGKLNATEITSEKINSPHILILHLTLRLFAFSLSEGEELKPILINITPYFVILPINSRSIKVYCTKEKYTAEKSNTML